MAVAKSYETWKIMGEPFAIDNKMWVIAQHPCPRCSGTGNYAYNPKDGTTCLRCYGTGKENKQVRWYTDAQRAAMDKRAAAPKKEKEAPARPQMNARYNWFGFGEAGYITLLVGDNAVINEWAHETDPCRARYNMFFGWFVPSKMEIENLPEGITTVRLNWDDVGNEDNSLREGDVVEQKVRELRGQCNSTSEYQGEVGEWLVTDVTVRGNYAVSSQFGAKTIHTMTDAEGNVYVWTTGAKNFAAGTTLKLKMKVKEHKEYKGEKQTVVWYCKEVA